MLHLIGDKGLEVIGEMFHRLDASPAADPGTQAPTDAQLGPATQTLKYWGAPRAVGKLDIEALVRQAQRVAGIIVMKCAVGDTLV